MKNDNGIIYVLTNPAMPGFVKIGKTGNSAEERMSTLYTTGVPVPFDCKYAGKVESMSQVEKAFHEAFGPYRVNPKREFFDIDPQQAIALLKLIETEDVTPSIQQEAANDIDSQSQQAAQTLKAKRPNMNFREMGIAVGEILDFIYEPELNATAEVVDEKNVSFEGQITSLTRLTRQLMGREYDVQPSGYWAYKGKRLRDIYEETYTSTD